MAQTLRGPGLRAVHQIGRFPASESPARPGATQIHPSLSVGRDEFGAVCPVSRAGADHIHPDPGQDRPFDALSTHADQSVTTAVDGTSPGMVTLTGGGNR